MADKKLYPEALLEKLPNSVQIIHAVHDKAKKERLLQIGFSEKGFGFGVLTFLQTPQGLFLDTEHLSLERVRKYVNLLLDEAILDTDQDPEKHRLYGEVMGRTCGAGCPVCNSP